MRPSFAMWGTRADDVKDEDIAQRDARPVLAAAAAAAGREAQQV